MDSTALNERVYRRGLLCTLALLVVSCATTPQYAGAPLYRDGGGLDTYHSRCAQNPELCVHLAGEASSAASTASRAAPVGLALLQNDGGNPRDELERRLLECVQLADQQVNRRHFGDRSPNADDCWEEVEVEVDGCVERVTRAVALGRDKHKLAAECARQVLDELWPGTYSLEQRYRYFELNDLLELVSAEQEARLLAQGCTQGLWRTIKPDLVLHVDSNKLLVCRVYDFKFPCIPGKEPRWTRYGEKSAFASSTQKDIYEKALKCEAFIIWPGGVRP